MHNCLLLPHMSGRVSFQQRCIPCQKRDVRPLFAKTQHDENHPAAGLDRFHIQQKVTRKANITPNLPASDSPLPARLSPTPAFTSPHHTNTSGSPRSYILHQGAARVTGCKSAHRTGDRNHGSLPTKRDCCRLTNGLNPLPGPSVSTCSLTRSSYTSLLCNAAQHAATMCEGSVWWWWSWCLFPKI